MKVNQIEPNLYLLIGDTYQANSIAFVSRDADDGPLPTLDSTRLLARAAFKTAVG